MSLEGEECGIKTNCILPVAPPFKKQPGTEAIYAQLLSTGLQPEDAAPELVVGAHGDLSRQLGLQR
jgi:hypothetical protein